MMFNDVYRMVRQIFIRCKAYVFIRLERLDDKAKEHDFLYVIMQIINKKTSMCVEQPQRNIYGGLSSTSKGKGRGM
jgi:hypothetical protein